jgi:hypothetical protein
VKFEITLQIFEKNNHISKFMNIRPVGPELLHVADGQTDDQKDGQTDAKNVVRNPIGSTIRLNLDLGLCCRLLRLIPSGGKTS